MPFFPLIVEERITHVVIYEADDLEQAVRMAQSDTGDLFACLGSHTRADGDLTVSVPETDWERALVKEPSSFGYPGQANAERMGRPDVT